MAENRFFQSPIDKLIEESKSYELPKVELPRSTAPRSAAQSMRSNGLLPPQDLQPLFEEASAEFGVPLNVLAALGQQESSYNAGAIGTQTKWGRAKGLMQYIDPTAQSLGINPFDPKQSVYAAAKQMRERLDKGYSMEEAIMAHHGGDDRRQWGPKTRNYVQQVMGKAGAIGEGFMRNAPKQEQPEEFDLSAIQTELDAKEPGRFKVLSPEEVQRYQKRTELIGGQGQLQAAQDALKPGAPTPLTIENQQATQTTPQAAPSPLTIENQRRVENGLTPTDTRPHQGFLEATGNALSNVPERFQQSIAGLIQMAGEDMGQERERFIADRARQYGITPGDMKLLAWAGNQKLVDPKMNAQQALEYVKKNIAPALNEQQLKELSAAGIINPEEITAFAKGWRDDTKKTMAEVRPEPGSAAFYGSAAIASIAEMAPMIAGAIVTRSPKVAMSIMGGQVGGQSYAEGREKGLSEDQAQTYALLTAAAEALPEALVVGHLLKPGAGAVKKVLEGTVLEGAQEAVTSALQAGIDKQMIDPNMTLREALVQIRDGAIVGMLAGGGMGATFAGADAVMNRGKSTPQERIEPTLDEVADPTATPGPTQSETTPESAAPATPAAETPEQVAPAPVNDNTPPAAPEAAPQPPKGPLSRAAERVVQQPSEPVTVVAPDGEVAGTLESYVDHGNGQWSARVQAEDGNTYDFTHEDGVDIVRGQVVAPEEVQQEEVSATEEAPVWQPEEAAVITPEQQAAEPVVDPVAEQPVAQPVEIEQPAAPIAEAQKAPIDQMSATELRAELKAVSAQLKQDRANAELKARRKAIETAINALTRPKQEKPVTAAKEIVEQQATAAPAPASQAQVTQAQPTPTQQTAAVEQGSDAQAGQAKPLKNTRNTGARFHGTSRPLPDGGPTNDGVYSGSDKNIYGQGFYTTDAVDIAAGYTRKGKGEAPTLYEIKERKPVKLYGMDQPMPDDVRRIAREVFGDSYPEDSVDGYDLNTLTGLYDEFRASSRYEGMSTHDVQDYFDSMRYRLEQIGYRGLEHSGGRKTGNDAHAVKIYWYPQDDLQVDKGDIETYRDAPAEKPKSIAGKPGKRDKVVTPAGREVDVEYRVVEAGDLITSNTDSGAVNPDYPKVLQPRDRSRAASELQINDIAANMNPRLLAEGPTTADGAPIVSEAGVVESGNGRTLAVKRAYARSMASAERYKQYLAEQGYDVAGMKEPVLVRVRQGDMSDADLVEYTRESNERTTLSMSATERAMADAKGMLPIVADYQGGDLASASNRDFVRAFISDVVAKSDQAGMMDGSGTLSQEGRRRIEGALLAAAYGDPAMVAEVFESTDSDIKAIGGALLDAAGLWAQMRQATQDQTIQDGLDITPNLMEAVNLIRRARSEGKKIFELVNQDDIFAGETHPITKNLMGVFYRGESYARARGREKVADALQSYARQALATQPGESLFGDALPPAQPENLLEQANARNVREETQAGQQAGLFGSPQPAAERDGRAGGEGQGPRAGKAREAAAEPDEGVRFSVAAPGYQIDHKPMTTDGGASTLDDLTPAFGDDIYGPDALQYFGSGDPREREVVRILKRLRGKPDAEVTIYRGVPAEAEGINPGDWVTISKAAAQDYADQHEGGKVISLKVPASHVTGWADSLLEFGYYPEGSASFSVASGHPFAGFTREQFLGNPTITKDTNSADLKPRVLTTVEPAEAEPFAAGSDLTAKYSPDGAAVFDGDKVVASYNFGNTLVVDNKYRRQGIAEELVYQWRMRNPQAKPARERTKKSQALQEKVWDRIERELEQQAPRYSMQDGVPQGEFGPIFQAANASEAIERLMREQTGEAIINKDGIGEISLIYGDRNMGLAHIAARRGEAILQRLGNLIDNGEVYTRDGQTDRVFIGNDRKEAVIRMTWNGQAKTWLLSAYEKYPDLQASEAPQQGNRSQVVADRTTSMSANDVRKAITKGVFGNVVDKMVEKGLIVIHSNNRSLPKNAGRGKAGVQAVTTEDNVVHLVASNLTPQNANAVLLHEMFHSGVESLVGSKRWSDLQGRLGSLYRQAEASNGKAREIFDRARARVADAKAQGAVARRMEVEEFGAYAIEEYESLPSAFRKWVDDLVGAIKAWMFSRYGRQIGNVTPAQLRALAKDALITIALHRRGELFGPIAERFSSVKVTETPAFKRWFGSSKVVDENGEPLVVYHGTGASFDTFDLEKVGENFAESSLGFYFTNAAKPDIGAGFGYGSTASEYAENAGNSPNVMPVYLSLQNPLIIGDAAEWGGAVAALDRQRSDIKRWAALGNHDGIIYRDETGDDLETIYVAFRPEQIKSAIGNNGDFDPANPDIRYSVKPSEHFKDLTQAQKDFLDKIGPTKLPQRLRDRMNQLTDNLGLRIRQAGVDRYAALLRNDQALLGEDTLEGSIASSAWVLARMSHAAGGAVSALMNSGRIYLDTKEKVIDIRDNTEGLAETLRSLGSPQEIDRFMGWIAANRSNRLAAEGRENLFTPAQIEAGMKLSGGKLENGKSRSILYAKAWKELQQHRDDVLSIAEKTGMLKPAMSKPAAGLVIAREYGAPESVIKQLTEARKSLDAATTPDMLNTAEQKVDMAHDALLKWLDGAVQDIQMDALSTPQQKMDAIKQRLADMQKSQRELWSNEFYVPFYRVLDEENLGGPSFGGGNGLSRQKAYEKLKGGKQNLNDLLENTLLNFHHLIQASLKNQAAAQAVANAEQLGIAEKTTESGRDKKTSTYVMIDGEKQWYNIDDPLTFKAISAISHAGLNNPAMKIGRAFKRFFTNMTTITPQFVVANTIRDSLSAMATSPTSPTPLANAIKGAITYGNDHNKARMMASGAAFSFGHVYGNNPDELKASLTGNMRSAKVLTDPKLIPGVLASAWRKWHQVTDFAENVNRAGIWERNLDKGKLKAAFEARDLMDFSAHGDAITVRVFTDLVPFLNARVQGLDKLYRAGFKTGARTITGKANKAERQAFGRFMAVTGALMMASTLLFLHNHDDDEYRKLEDWQRDTYWVIRVGDDMYFIPKPFEVGAIATMGERLAEQFVDPTVGGEKFAERLWHMLTDTFSLDLTPQAVKPAVEVFWKNKDSFTGRQIEDQSMDRLSPSLRSRPDTSRLADAASRGMEVATSAVGGQDIALSPVQIDHLIRGYTGAVGATAVATADTIWRRAMGEELPARHWHEYQPIKRFYRDLTQEPNYTRYGTDFYEALKKADRAYADLQHLQKYGDEKRAAELAEGKADELAMQRALNGVRRGMSKINADMKRIQMDKEMSGEAKRLELDRLRSMRNLITEQVGKDLEQEKIRKRAAAD